ncbi:spermatogenesis associated 2-like isoform 1-T1 [Odontesthes bonariensis]|uniref:spermatogenesis associated 2-like isoform X1 n=1 Tax=Odontesthes bonariensis TaxID=219752 RepID=UPI003F58DE5E
MSISRQSARHLLMCYDQILEQQIVGRGSNLACRDEELWMQVEELLRDGDAQETHCLGPNPLLVMEESLKAASAPAPAAACSSRATVRRELQGFAKAFEVLEQAALNLYLGPWRKEYRVIKMYSGTFTHCITPVLSMSQIEELFGLLGYQLSPSCPEQLCLPSPRFSRASLDGLLRLSCAFFIARCECHLLLTALGQHVGDTQWELSVVRERLRGNSLQVALDNTKKTLEVNQPPMELTNVEVDLYGDEQVNGGQKEVAVSDEESTCPLNEAAQSNALPPAVQTRSNGVTYTSPQKESDTTKSSSASKRQDTLPCEEFKSDKTDSQQIQALVLGKGEPEASHLCSCLDSSPLFLKRCFECNTLHNISCASLYVCNAKGHNVSSTDSLTEKMTLPLEVSPSSGSVRESARNTLPSSGAEMTSSSLLPISFHECCNPSKLDPQLLCRSCRVFHSGSCREGKLCKTSHDISVLGKCSCGKVCSRKPLVLCRYCGNEYCSICWYRNPVTCSCGQTFDQSTPV